MIREGRRSTRIRGNAWRLLALPSPAVLFSVWGRRGRHSVSRMRRVGRVCRVSHESRAGHVRRVSHVVSVRNEHHVFI